MSPLVRSAKNFSAAGLGRRPLGRELQALFSFDFARRFRGRVEVHDVEADDPHTRGVQVVVGPAPAEHVEHELARAGQLREDGTEVVEQPPQVQVVELPRARVPAGAPGAHADSRQHSRGRTAGRIPSSDSPAAGAMT